ncbi:MAG: hypothetical protein HRU15_05430, partial [Planctomycetes bacterium]|nr:hypothetical protein [Planctomycetota bacterium]
MNSSASENNNSQHQSSASADQSLPENSYQSQPTKIMNVDDEQAQRISEAKKCKNCGGDLILSTVVSDSEKKWICT